MIKFTHIDRKKTDKHSSVRQKETDIETEAVVRDSEEHQPVIAAWIIVYNSSFTMPGIVLAAYFENRRGKLDLYSGIFFRDGRFRNRCL